jgi:Tfp pilus assembly protein FimT
VKYFYWGIAAAVVLTVLAVLFVPGVDQWVEQTVLRNVGRAAR